MSALRSYLVGSGAHVAARGVEAACGFATVWLATRMTSVAEYGALLLALTCVGLLHLLVTGCFERIVVFRVARREAGDGAGLAAAGVRRALAAGLLAAPLLVASGPALARLFGDASVAAWLALVAFRLPAAALPTVHAAWLRGRERVAESIWLGQAVPSLLTVAALAVVWSAGGGRTALGLALVAGPLAAGAVSLWRRPLPLRRPGVRLGRADLAYGAKLGASALVHRGVWTTDVLLVGALASSVDTAHYGVAARVAGLALVAHQALGGVLAPRMGRLLASGRRAELASEYDRVRSVSLCAALGVVAAVLVSGGWILGLFGEAYAAAWPVLVVLAAAYVVPVAFGSNGALLNMAGHGGWSLATSSLLLGANVALGIAWIPRLGALGAAAATGVALLGANLVVAGVAARLEGLRTVQPLAAAAGAVAVVAAAAAVAGLLDPPSSALLATGALLPVAARAARSGPGAGRRPGEPGAVPVREGS